MWLKQYIITVATDATGVGVGYTPEAVRGRIMQIRYVKDSYENGVVFTITLETTGVNVWTQTGVNASATVLPRQPVQDQAGVDATSDGTRKLREPIYVASERIAFNVTVATQGNTPRSGTFYVLVG